ncbi:MULTISPECIES: D-amino-acid transaminase [Fictibacillus]|uniref:D-alanine aminotransferase n=1 Tax=Fictibacillus enclensis TaxID=1017270 RepID=A0A0V8JE92_9BACL|nr:MULTISPECIES: D-amino-acid transaminase [Fictibacillus]KSU85284.1 D-alanine aminotransferase [Fictibacillus enclensis]RXY99050.1 D-amino-acid transaminase [Fictibacillus sp. S7]SCB94367.1 D-alanine aminotransferase apoenzyme [Fictibacillus enclensis]
MENPFVLFGNQIIERDHVSIDMEDRGYNFGDGIYEVVYIYGGEPFSLNEHFRRFEESAQKLDMKLPYSIEQIKEKTAELIKANNIHNGIVYIQMTRGASPRAHLFERESACLITGFARKMDPPAEAQEKGIKTYLTPDIRWLRCDIKSLNLLGNTMAKRIAADHSCGEALQHREGLCTEGSSSNLYIVKHNEVRTHPATNLILNGITRQHILEIAGEEGIAVNEEPFTTEELQAADEVFISSTTMEIAPVISVEGDVQATYPIGPVTRRLQEKLKDRIKQHRVHQ